MISHRLGLVGQDVLERLRRLLVSYGLPTFVPDVEPVAVLQAMALDKKVREKSIRWVLLQGLGKPVVRADVTQELMAEVVGQLAE